jgi:hypothetical protein
MSNFNDYLQEQLKDIEFKMYWDILVLEEKLECLERENNIKISENNEDKNCLKTKKMLKN